MDLSPPTVCLSPERLSPTSFISPERLSPTSFIGQGSSHEAQSGEVTKTRSSLLSVATGSSHEAQSGEVKKIRSSLLSVASVASSRKSSKESVRVAEQMLSEGKEIKTRFHEKYEESSRENAAEHDEQLAKKVAWTAAEAMLKRYSSVRMRFVRQPRHLEPPPMPLDSKEGASRRTLLPTARQRLDEAAEAIGNEVARGVLMRLVGAPLPLPPPPPPRGSSKLRAGSKQREASKLPASLLSLPSPRTPHTPQSPSTRSARSPRSPRWLTSAGSQQSAPQRQNSNAPVENMMQMWCGSCEPRNLLETRTLHPAVIDYEDLPELKLILAHGKDEEEDAELPEEPGAANHLGNAKGRGHSSRQNSKSSVAGILQKSLAAVIAKNFIFQDNLCDITPPTPPAQSAFSRDPHPQLPFLPMTTVSRLDVQTLQQRVKLPRLKEIVDLDFAVSDDTEVRLRGDKAKEDMRLDLRLAAVRTVVKKPLSDRNHDDAMLLEEYLRQSELFVDLKPETLSELADSVELRHFHPGAVICKERQKLEGAHILLRGNVVLRAGSFAVLLGKAAQFGSTQVRGPGTVLGMMELQAHGGVQRPDSWDSSSLWTTTAQAGQQTSVEALFLPSAHAKAVFQAALMEEKLDALAIFPPTKGRSKADLFEKSRVVRQGVKVPLQALFDVLEFQRHHVFYRTGDKPPLDQSFVMLLISGSVRLKEDKGDRRETILEEGAVFGEQALKGQPQDLTAQVVSKRARVLVISAADYSNHFLGGRLRQASQPATASSEEQHPSTARSRRQPKREQHRELHEVGRRQLGQKMDREKLQTEEWQLMRPVKLPGCVRPYSQAPLETSIKSARESRTRPPAIC